MTQFNGILARTDGWVLLAWFGLIVVGLATVFSCTVDFRVAGGETAPSAVGRDVFFHQAIWVGMGVLSALLCMLVSFRHFETFAYVLYGLALLALVAVFFVGPEIAGSRRWLAVGGFSVQPSELAKVVLIFALARFLAGRAGKRSILLLGGVLLLVLPVFLLVSREPDLGTSLVYPAIAVPMLFWAGVRARFLMALASPFLSAAIALYCQEVLSIDREGSLWMLPWVVYVVGLLVALYYSRVYLLQSSALVLANVVTGLGVTLAWDYRQPYQQSRIRSFLNPSETDRLGSGYQTFQSKVAIGSGGLTGQGYLEGSQKGLAFLPERHTDFIFSVVGEELGLFGAVAVLLLFWTLVLRSLRVATQAKSSFGSLLVVGVAGYFAFQCLVNISITVGLLPVTGIPLPLISYGGSSMLASCIMIGVLLNVCARWHEV
jgi:rod shape determining protein RodA